MNCITVFLCGGEGLQGRTQQHILLHKNLQTISVSSWCWWPHLWPVKSCEEKSCHNGLYLCGKTQNKNLSTRTQADVIAEVCWCYNSLYQPQILKLMNWVLYKWFLNVRWNELAIWPNMNKTGLFSRRKHPTSATNLDLFLQLIF